MYNIELPGGVYYEGANNKTWTTDKSKAKDFATKLDAETFIISMQQAMPHSFNWGIARVATKTVPSNIVPVTVAGSVTSGSCIIASGGRYYEGPLNSNYTRNINFAKVFSSAADAQLQIRAAQLADPTSVFWMSAHHVALFVPPPPSPPPVPSLGTLQGFSAWLPTAPPMFAPGLNGKIEFDELKPLVSPKSCDRCDEPNYYNNEANTEKNTWRCCRCRMFT